MSVGMYVGFGWWAVGSHVHHMSISHMAVFLSLVVFAKVLASKGDRPPVPKVPAHH